ncbi:NAD(P)/FAD-dependent oxidoreductase [Ancylobacter sp. Lp-2]|uniref:FAD/NAD(P)-dependent oxidoreductase n=1 Tax=Ancylobacter sp. Lp-2 TaxID=2881339 RepID=UPI001E385A6B|nr:NAD(P)/FAD-dependent oxidoreductase [Ancylobacter sp. Lp-2]MCB4771027.1 NAD(P)/FAD-dependent oxidoreductase [Ancylobacter sp. Lp-2]
MIETVDAVIIGAGPAGAAAAASLRELGIASVLLDERPEAGGNIYRGALGGAFARSMSLGKDYASGAAWLREAISSGLDVRPSSAVSRIDADVVSYDSGGTIRRLRTRHLVLATGAIERAMPLPGWTLPGVMGVGAAQLLMKQSGLVPDGRYVLCGNGPLLLLLAKQLIDLGALPAAIVETGRRTPIRTAFSHGPALLEHRASVAKGLGFLAAIRQAGIPVYRDARSIRVEGDARVRAIRFTSAGQAHELAVDLVLCHEGIVPNIQLSLTLGCAHDWDDAQASFRPRVDAWGETSRPGTFAIGDCAGILGAAAAPHSGRLAALAIASALDRLRPAQRDQLASLERRHLLSERRFRHFLDDAYRPALSAQSPIADEVVVCRCERIAANEVRAAVRDGARGPAQAKVFTRCGMGPCQGRVCGPAVTRIIAEETGQSREEIGNYHPRFPLKPMVLAELATAPDEEADHADAA